MKQSEFYVGYLPQAPSGIAAQTRRTVLLLLVLAAGVAALAAIAHRRLPAAAFEYGSPASFEGVLWEKPFPTLEVPRPGLTEGAATASVYDLVALGKHGAKTAVEGLDGQRVRLEGTLVYRGGRTMIELVEGSVADLGASGEDPVGRESLGTFSLQGEIVDSKCFLGVMNPGDKKQHRACASLCIRGGIPPVLCVQDERGEAVYFLLVSESGEPVNEEVLDLVAEPVSIRGEVVRFGDRLVLYSNPATFERLP